MPPSRSRLTLDEQSFQGLLAAAFTIQQHNDRQKNDRQNSDLQENDQPKNSLQENDRPRQVAQSEQIKTELSPSAPVEHDQVKAKPPAAARLCPQCAAPLPGEGTPCPNCRAENFRPGERLQRTWASMWLKSQEQNLKPQPPESSATQPAAPALSSLSPHNGHGASSSIINTSSPAARADETKLIAGAQRDAGDELAIQPPAFNQPSFHSPDLSPANAVSRGPSVAETELAKDYDPSNNDEIDDDLLKKFLQGDLSDDASPAHEPHSFESPILDSASTDSASIDSATADSASRVPAEVAAATTSSPIERILGLRVKLRFHRADLYLGMAISIAILALLWPASTPQAPSLHPWERILIAMGIAEEPAPAAAHFHGDPNLKVWVDTHTALYYCPGDELYGKSPDGHFTTQRDAALDHFEPAERSACVE